MKNTSHFRHGLMCLVASLGVSGFHVPSVSAAAVSIGTVSPTSVTANTPTTLSASASAPSGIQYCHLYVEAEDVGAMDVSGSTASKSYTFTRSGVHTVFVFCKDNAGGMASGPNTSVMVTGGTSGYVPPYSGTTPPPAQQQQQPAQQQPTGPTGPAAGSLIKLECPADAAVDNPCKAVYYVGKDGKRHAFSNDKVFFSWYAGFDSVTSVASGIMGTFPLGKNITYRPGSRMVKFTTLNNVYAISKSGGLRWVTSEAIAISLYGTDWNTKIDDIADTFYGDYKFGTDITDVTQYSVQGELGGAASPDDVL